MDENTEIKNSIVYIEGIRREYDEVYPWRSPDLYDSSGTGFIIENNFIVTNHHVVARMSKIQVCLASDTDKFSATVILSASDCDLALLHVQDQKFYQNTKPLKFNFSFDFDSNVTYYGFPIIGDNLAIVSGSICRLHEASTNSGDIRILQFESNIYLAPGSSGGPYISDGCVIGIHWASYSQFNNIGLCISAMCLEYILSHFINNKPYKGFPVLPVIYQELHNPALRKLLGMEKKESGIRICKVSNELIASHKILPDDVLLSIDDYIINNDATVDIGEKFNVNFMYLATKKFFGEKILIQLLRDKVKHNISLRLDSSISQSILITKEEPEFGPTYYINSCLVFRVLTYSYLEKMLKNNEQDFLEQRYKKFSLYAKTLEQEEIIVIDWKLLKIDINSFNYEISNESELKSINGIHPKHIIDVIEAMEQNQNKYHIVETISNEKYAFPVISEHRHNTLLNEFGIAYDRSYNLRESNYKKLYLDKFLPNSTEAKAMLDVNFYLRSRRAIAKKKLPNKSKLEIADIICWANKHGKEFIDKMEYKKISIELCEHNDHELYNFNIDDDISINSSYKEIATYIVSGINSVKKFINMNISASVVQNGFEITFMNTVPEVEPFMQLQANFDFVIDNGARKVCVSRGDKFICKPQLMITLMPMYYLPFIKIDDDLIVKSSYGTFNYRELKELDAQLEKLASISYEQQQRLEVQKILNPEKNIEFVCIFSGRVMRSPILVKNKALDTSVALQAHLTAVIDLNEGFSLDAALLNKIKNASQNLLLSYNNYICTKKSLCQQKDDVSWVNSFDRVSIAESKILKQPALSG